MIAKKRDIRLLLDDIRSVHNVGSIFRTAETVGVSRIYCAGTTPTPLDRFNQKRSDFAKVALGAEDLISWEHLNQSASLRSVRALKKEGFKAISLEQDSASIDYKKIKATEKMLIILGNEVGGVSRSLLKLSDQIAEIPLKGKKESLNVSVAAGVFLFQFLN
jgi:tRNA G18 (ribose-2'-O)-methylase SpoU